MRKSIKTLVCGMMILSMAMPQMVMPQMTGGPSEVYAATTGETLEGKCGDNVKYTYDVNDKVLTISGTGEMWDDMKYPVEVHRATKLVIEKGVTVIGANAFISMDRFESIEIADTVTTIRDYAFSMFVGVMEIPASVTSMGTVAITSCEKLIIKGDLKGYDYSAFGYGVEEIVLHGTADDLGKAIYSMQMPVITIAKDNDKCTIKNGCILSKDGKKLYFSMTNKSTLFIPDSVEIIGEAAFGSTQTIKVVLGNKVKEICDGAFAYSEIREIKIPKNVKTIGNGAFLNSSLDKVTINGNVKLGENAFGRDAVITNKAGIKKTRTSVHTCELKNGKMKISFNKVKDATGYRIFVKAGKKTYKFDTKSNVYNKKMTKQISKYYKSVEDIYADDESVAIKVTVKPYKEVKGKKVFGKVSNSKNLMEVEE